MQDDLRLATDADVAALASLYAEAARALGPAVYSEPQVAAWAGFGADTPDFRAYVLQAQTWVAMRHGRPVGFCGIDETGEVRSLYVHPSGMRQGLGGRLLAHAIVAASARGIERFAAWVTPFSRPLFERAGFRHAGSVCEPYQGVLFERHRVERP